jgi:hypothetical protein
MVPNLIASSVPENVISKAQIHNVYTYDIPLTVTAFEAGFRRL